MNTMNPDLGHHDEQHHYPKAELRDILRRLGTPPATIQQIDRELPDPVDLDECGALLQKYGLTRDAIISLLGGSP